MAGSASISALLQGVVSRWKQTEKQRTEEVEGPVEGDAMREEAERQEDLYRDLPDGETIGDSGRHFD